MPPDGGNGGLGLRLCRQVRLPLIPRARPRQAPPAAVFRPGGAHRLPRSQPRSPDPCFAAGPDRLSTSLRLTLKAPRNNIACAPARRRTRLCLVQIVPRIRSADALLVRRRSSASDPWNLKLRCSAAAFDLGPSAGRCYRWLIQQARSRQRQLTASLWTNTLVDPQAGLSRRLTPVALAASSRYPTLRQGCLASALVRWLRMTEHHLACTPCRHRPFQERRHPHPADPIADTALSPCSTGTDGIAGLKPVKGSSPSWHKPGAGLSGRGAPASIRVAPSQKRPPPAYRRPNTFLNGGVCA